MRIENEKISSLLAQEKISKLDTADCNKFNDYISEHYPWYGCAQDRIDWEKVQEYKRLAWADVNAQETVEYFKTTCIGKYDSLGIVFSALEPGVVGSFDEICNNLELFSTYCPWVLFIVGAVKDKYGLYTLSHEDFVELWRWDLILTAPR